MWKVYPKILKGIMEFTGIGSTKQIAFFIILGGYSELFSVNKISVSIAEIRKRNIRFEPINNNT